MKKSDVNVLKAVLGIFFALMFAATVIFFHSRYEAGSVPESLVQIAEVVFLGLSLNFFITMKRRESSSQERPDGERRRISVSEVCSLAAVLIAVPVTIFVGMYFLNDRKYYLISMLIILETLIPFFMRFENRKPQVRELVIISVLCAIAVAGRAAFYMIPQFKPIAAVVIISAAAFGAETGFLTGAVSAFVSNFFFGQGPWTPWQMFAFGIIGFLAGVLFRNGALRRSKAALCIFGGLSVLILYGGLMNSSMVFMYQANPTPAMFLSSMAMGLPFDAIHSAATVFFLWFAAEPFLEKLDRVKTKYGI